MNWEEKEDETDDLYIPKVKSLANVDDALGQTVAETISQGHIFSDKFWHVEEPQAQQFLLKHPKSNRTKKTEKRSSEQTLKQSQRSVTSSGQNSERLLSPK